jgi:hypothetical protein
MLRSLLFSPCAATAALAALLLVLAIPATAAEGTIWVIARVVDTGPSAKAEAASQHVLACGPADQMLADGMARIRLATAPDDAPGFQRVTVEFVAN